MSIEKIGPKLLIWSKCALNSWLEFVLWLEINWKIFCAKNSQCEAHRVLCVGESLGKLARSYDWDSHTALLTVDFQVQSQWYSRSDKVCSVEAKCCCGSDILFLHVVQAWPKNTRLFHVFLWLVKFHLL